LWFATREGHVANKGKHKRKKGLLTSTAKEKKKEDRPGLRAQKKCERGDRGEEKKKNRGRPSRKNAAPRGAWSRKQKGGEKKAAAQKKSNITFDMTINLSWGRKEVVAFSLGKKRKKKMFVTFFIIDSLIQERERNFSSGGRRRKNHLWKRKVAQERMREKEGRKAATIFLRGGREKK